MALCWKTQAVFEHSDGCYLRAWAFTGRAPETSGIIDPELALQRESEGPRWSTPSRAGECRLRCMYAL